MFTVCAADVDESLLPGESAADASERLARAKAKAAAAAPIKSVRVKGDTAFIIFTPKGGKPSFFVMKREGGAWKAISLGPGTPLEP